MDVQIYSSLKLTFEEENLPHRSGGSSLCVGGHNSEVVQG